MISAILAPILLGVASFPFIYYVLVLYSSWRFFRQATVPLPEKSAFTPPVSNLKPVRGLDPEAYENFASYCRQDYPDYELIFCVGDENDPSVPVLEKLIRDLRNGPFRCLTGRGGTGCNPNVRSSFRW